MAMSSVDNGRERGSEDDGGFGSGRVAGWFSVGVRVLFSLRGGSGGMPDDSVRNGFRDHLLTRADGFWSVFRSTVNISRINFTR